MNEKETELIAQEEKVEEIAKPYEFRQFQATDLFPMMRLIKKIGITAFTKILFDEDLGYLIGSKKAESDDDFVKVGVFAFKIGELVIERLSDCEKEVFDILEKTSNLSMEQLHHLKMDIFFEMIMDFLRKDDFVDFSKAVLRLFK